MSVAKVIELSSQSEKSFEHAIELGIRRASESVDELRNAWVKDMEVVVENGAPKLYRVSLKTTFEVNPKA